ncbi:WYL domain-containing protein [bacterium]|nr:WYL domain-containing protein [bacterium]
MKKFMETNIVTHNLMSFSGFKSLLIFSMLVEGPKTYEEIKERIENNEYMKETISIDSIRIYMNSLKKIGCEIQKTHQGRTVKYYISSHPYELKITDKQAKSIIKVFKAISKSIELSDFMALHDFFCNISKYIQNEDLKAEIIKLSPVSNINMEMIKELMQYARNKTEITVLYNAKNSGKKKEITINADKMNIRNGKLYLCGFNSEHNNYGEFLVKYIIKIIRININTPELKIPEFKVIYKYYRTDNTPFELLSSEKILEQNDSFLIVEIKSYDKFAVTQRILSLSNKCKVISPNDFKDEIIACLKRMKEGYIEKK